MEESRNFQNEIARKIIIQVGLLTLLLCFGLIAIFGLEIYWATNATLTTGYVIRMLLEVLAATCVFCLLMFVALYFISRNVALKSLRPLHEALERERSFTSYASHEFRTPLAVLRGSMEVLIRKPRTETEYRTKIAECINEVDAMNQMVEDLLTLTRVESGRRSLESEPIAIIDLLNDVTSHYAEQLINRGIHISVQEFPKGITAVTDRRALSTMLSNIIGNAVKYCDDGGMVSISCTTESTESVKIAVTNSGQGIPKDEIDHIWDKFYRGISSGGQRVKGFGLGLSIVRHFADLIGAGVTISSDRGKPTTVTLTLKS